MYLLVGQVIIQSIKPFFSPEDIQKGEYWSTTLKDQLNKNVTGIICLTNDNQNAPWILYEAGALSNGIGKNKVFPLLFDFEISELKGPLSLFNATKFKKEDFLRLINSINNDIENSLDKSVLENTFEKFWTELESKISKIVSKYTSSNQDIKKIIRSEKDILEELVILQRESVRINANDKEQQETNIKNIESNILKISDSLLTIKSNFKDNENNSYSTKYKRPKKIEAEIFRYNLGAEKWLNFIGFINKNPVEIFSKRAEDYFVPDSINTGHIIFNKNDSNEERYDFQFEDKQGYKVTIEGLSRMFNYNELSNYLKIVSLLISENIRISLIYEIIKKFKIEDFKYAEKWKKEIIGNLKIYNLKSPS